MPVETVNNGTAKRRTVGMTTLSRCFWKKWIQKHWL